MAILFADPGSGRIEKISRGSKSEGLMRRILSIVGGVLLLLGGMLILSPSASAATTGAYGCSGTQIDTYAVKTSGGSVWGTIHLYYDSSTGYNCAVNVATAAGYYGTPSFKAINMTRCVAGTVAGQKCVSDGTYRQDPAGSTLYSEYAGPVSFSAAGRCINVYGAIVSPDGNTDAYFDNGQKAMHCG
ncbi:hypothetical protein [Actinacidiphila alni]|uniref:hypothetical protein n=1 Tax=Actinacidiphila alni TaxID=380248 RepID=UPI003451A043